MNHSSAKQKNNDLESSISKHELNSWKRGFTPQAEIWNGRMASVGLILGLFSLILANNFLSNH